MNDETPSLHTVARRLERLERQNRLLKAGGLCALVLLASLVIMAPSKQIVTRIAAEEFSVVDSSGVVRATLGFEKGGSRLALYDSSGLMLVEVTATKDAAEFALYDDTEKHRILALVGSGQKVRDREVGVVRLPADVFFNLYDENRMTRASIRVAGDARLSVYDGEEKTVWTAPGPSGTAGAEE